MDQIDAIGRLPLPQRVNAKANGGVDPVAASSNRRSSDRAEFSAGARILSRIRQLPEVRQDLIDTVGARISAGGYDTDGKLSAALDELINDLELEELFG